MPTFMTLVRFTDETARSVAARPQTVSAQDVLQKLQDLAQEAELAGTLRHLFFTSGEYEMVLVTDMPSQRKAVAYGFAVTRMLNVRVTTFPAFDAGGMDEVIGDSSKVDGA
jgi:uncharacterized protein with GYD domain